jgi:mono/diheme cytochrome c family protein
LTGDHLSGVISRTILLVALASASMSAQTSPTPPKPSAPVADISATRDASGAFTDRQALLGEKVYLGNCASCHETSYHTGEEFRFSWFGRSVYDLFKLLKTTMPDDNVGGLSDDDYARVIAYILKLNGFAAGPDSLQADSTFMRRIRIGNAIRADSAKPRR